MHAGQRLLLQWVRLVRRRAAPVLILAVLATVGAAYVTVSNFRINTDTADMLSEELPFRRNNEALNRAFPQFIDTLSVVVEADSPGAAADAAESLAAELKARPELYRGVFHPESMAFFRRNGLLYLDPDELETLSDRLAEAQPLLAGLAEDMSLGGLAEVVSLAIGEASAKEGAAAIAPVLERIAETVESAARLPEPEARLRPLPWGTLMTGQDPGPEGRRQFIVLQPVLDYASLEPAAAAIRSLRNLASELGIKEENGLRARITGSAVMFQEELRSLRDGMGLVGLLSLVFVSVLLMLGLRSPRLVLATLAALVMGLVWTAFFATVAIGELNLISVAFAVLFIGLSVDFGIHYALRYRETLAAAGDHDSAAALERAAADVGGALALCALAAAIGFFAFLPTAYRGVSELGLISGVGMFIALFANLTVLPAVLGLLPLRGDGPPRRSSAGEWVAGVVTRHKRGVLSGAVALGILAALTLPYAWFDDDPMNLRDPDSSSVALLTELFDDSRVEPYSATILAKDLTAAAALAARLEALPEVAAAVTARDLVPGDQDLKLGIIDEMAVFLTPVLMAPSPSPSPDSAARRQALAALQRSLEGVTQGPLAAAARRLAAALGRLDLEDTTLARLEAALLGGLPRRLADLGASLDAEAVTLEELPPALRDRWIAADGRARIEVMPRDDLRDPAARRRFVDAVQAVAPEATGSPVIIAEAGRAVTRAFGEAAGTAVVLIALLLLAVLRSLRDTLMVLVPLVLAALLSVAATVVLRMPFNFANVIVLPLLFGLGVAGGIHIVARARARAWALGAGLAGVMATSTPRAVLFSALTTIGSFGALALSSHRGTASMGVLLTIAIGLTMLSTLIVLPALLAACARPAPRTGSWWAGFWRGRPRLAHWRVIALLLGLALLGFVATRSDLAAVGQHVLALGAPGALAALAVFFLAFLVDTASWQLMLPSARLGAGWLYRLWKLRMVGEALNLVIPAGSLGGEPFKAMLLKRNYGLDYREGGASLVIAKTVNLLALLVFCAVGVVLMLRNPAVPEAYRLAAGAGLAALGLGVLGFFAVQRWRAASRLAHWLARGWLARGRLGAWLERYLAHIEDVDDRFHGFYARRPGRFAAALTLALLNWLIGTAELYVIMAFLGQPVTVAEAWLIETVAQLVRAGIFFIPASLGASEAAMVLIYGALTGQPSLGLAVALIRRGRELLWIAWGFWIGWLFTLAPANTGAGSHEAMAAHGGAEDARPGS